MKIAIVGSSNFDSLEFHLNDELTIQNHIVSIFEIKPSIFSNKFDNALGLFSQKYVEYINRLTLKNILDFEPDLVIGTYRHIHPNLVKGVKKNNIKIIHVNPDALTTFQNQQIFAEPYDAYFTKDNFIKVFMKDKMKFNVFSYNEAFNPRFHQYKKTNFKELEKKVNIDVLSFGNFYPYRCRLIQHFIKSGVNVKMYGYKQKYFPSELSPYFENKPIYGKEKSRILSGSKIILNNFHYAEIESVNNKFFEINGSGAFQLTDYKKILHDLLPPQLDPKKVSFSTLDEAIKLTNHYLNNPEERYEIRELIQSHFIKNYTYKNLVKYIFECI